MRSWLALLLCGCGRVGFDALGDAGNGGAADAMADIMVPNLDTDYPTFTLCPPEFALVDQAQCTGGAIEMTPDTPNSRGAAWLAVPFPTDRNVSVRATITLSSAGVQASDGAAVVLQNDPRGTAAIGGFGSGLGYDSISPSIALELDTYSPGGSEPAAPHVGLNLDGDVTTGPIGPTPFALSDGTPFTVWLDYDQATKTAAAYIARTAQKPPSPVVTMSSDLAHLGSMMWIGLTASTGSDSQFHRVLALSIDFTP